MNRLLNGILILNSIKCQFKSCNSFTAKRYINDCVDSKQIQKINIPSIPIYKTKFRKHFCPIYWEIKENVFDRVYSLHYPHDVRRAKKSVNGSVSDIFASLFVPYVKRANYMVPITEMTAFFFFCDDYIGVEKSNQGFHDLNKVLFGNKAPEKPNEHIIKGITESVRSYYTDSQYNRYIDEMRAYLEECLNEVITKPIHNIDDLIKSREATIGTKPYLALLPLGLEIDITEFTANPILTRMETLITRHVVLVNDIYSFRKEAVAGDLKYNTLQYLYKQCNDYDKAIKMIIDLLVSYENEYFELESILKNQYPNAIELHDYIDSLEYVAGGNLIWSLLVPRYNIHNRYSLKVVVLLGRFSDLIEEVDRNEKLFTN